MKTMQDMKIMQDTSSYSCSQYDTFAAIIP